MVPRPWKFLGFLISDIILQHFFGSCLVLIHNNLTVIEPVANLRRVFLICLAVEHDVVSPHDPGLAEDEEDRGANEKSCQLVLVHLLSLIGSACSVLRVPTGCLFHQLLLLVFGSLSKSQHDHDVAEDDHACRDAH